MTHFADDVGQLSSVSMESRDSTFDLAQNEDSSLSSFLSRPIKIHSATWAVGAGISVLINPWRLFLTDPSVTARIDNYAYLRGDLRIKILINGNSFYYGKLLNAYHPLYSEDAIYGTSIAGTNTDLPFMALSQMPGVTVDASDNKGGVINADFLWPYNYVGLGDTLDTQRLGRLHIESFQNLRHGNGGTDPLTVSVFAWMENVVLTVPTTVSFQSGFFGEYGKGVISSAASSVSAAAGRLSKVPIIGPYARATADVSSSLGDLARVFGFSRPPVLDPLTPVRRNIMSSIAVTDNDETISKLALDSKQELTVDPRTVGIHPRDEMSLDFILKKESYLTQFLWDVSDTPGKLLWNAHVLPGLRNVDTTVATPNNSIIGTTPMSHISNLFQYWTGNIVFRFSIVASAFHKGRLRITVDPGHRATSNDDWNRVYSRVVDISEERDFEVCVDWLQKEAYRPCLLPGRAVAYHGSVAYVASDSDSNGIITVEVLNDLTTPNDASTDISIMAYVRGGDKLKFMAPRDALQNVKYTHGSFQSGIASGDTTAPPTAYCVGSDGTLSSDHSALIYGGESVASIRQLLRRYWFYQSLSMAPIANIKDVVMQEFHLPVYPVTPGFVTDGMHSTSVPENYNYVGMTLINYLTPCYLCRRGGIRYKAISPRSNSEMSIIQSKITRSEFAISSYASSRLLAATTDSPSAVAAQNIAAKATGAGSDITVVDTQPVLEVELPFYSNARFAFSRVVLNKGSARDQSNTQNMFVDIMLARLLNVPATEVTDLFVATGEDFGLFYYLHSPGYYIYNDPTPS